MGSAIHPVIGLRMGSGFSERTISLSVTRAAQSSCAFTRRSRFISNTCSSLSYWAPNYLVLIHGRFCKTPCCLYFRNLPAESQRPLRRRSATVPLTLPGQELQSKSHSLRSSGAPDSAGKARARTKEPRLTDLSRSGSFNPTPNGSPNSDQRCQAAAAVRRVRSVLRSPPALFSANRTMARGET